MKKQALNPYLPLDTYIPDGEPHVFGDRVYIFGSHDEENGTAFCVLDYEVFSAPLDDLGNWHSEGIIYRAAQDPDYGETYRHMYAPDVVQGNDGRFYLYYAMSGGCFTGPIHVAVCDSPAGKYEYYGEVRNADGSAFEKGVTFDPAVLNDNGEIYLYYGWGISSPHLASLPPLLRKILKKTLLPVLEQKLFDKPKEIVRSVCGGVEGGFVVHLAGDMLTVTNEPKKIVPPQIDSFGTSFEGHAFFEASSMRKIGNTYYFIYSSEASHELCYAVSSYPDRDFQFGGVIVSNGDIGYHGRKAEDRLAMTGNNHGSIVNIRGQWYIFYHRQTNKTSFSRQGCAERIELLSDGTIAQVEMTSCGLNDGALKTQGVYPAPIACNLSNGHMPHIDGGRKVSGTPPYVACKDGERIICDFSDGCFVGYKYFEFDVAVRLEILLRGEATGILQISTGDNRVARLDVTPSENWATICTDLTASGIQPLYLKFSGKGSLELKELRFVRKEDAI